MTGTIYGLPLSQRVDVNGSPLSGALLYLFQANTTVPVNSYQDFGLTILNPNPLVCDSAGMIPEFWLNDGAYRVRLTTAAGVILFDRPNVTALGPSTGGGGGGGGGAAVDPTTIAQTGDMLWVPFKGIVRSGWLMSDGRTFGSASSGAGQRANADTQALYIALWNALPDALCPVTSGRGATGLVDFTANKPIQTLDMRDYGIFGLGDMGNTDAGRIVSGTPTQAGTAIGSETATITISQANLPNYNLNISGLSITNGSAVATGANSGTFGNTVGSPNRVTLTQLNTSALSIAGTIPSGGSGTSLTPTTISLGRFGTFYMKL